MDYGGKVASNVITVISGAIGVLLGGGIRTIEAYIARRHEQRSVLYALVAEVDSLARIARHRRYLEAYISGRDGFREMVGAGHGEALGSLGVLQVQADYFAVFDALRPKLGLLTPMQSSRIIRFYVLAKTVLENARPDSQWVTGQHPVSELLEVLENDIAVLEAVLGLADEIVQFVPDRMLNGGHP